MVVLWTPHQRPKHRERHIPIEQRHEEGQPAEGAGHLRERQIRGHQRRQGGGIGEPHPAIGAGHAASRRRGQPGATGSPASRSTATPLDSARGPPPTAAAASAAPAHRRSAPTRSRYSRHVRSCRPNCALTRGTNSVGPAKGVCSSSCQDPFHHRRIDLALAQHKGAKVFATLPKIFEMLAGRLPVGTAHDRG